MRLSILILLSLLITLSNPAFAEKIVVSPHEVNFDIIKHTRGTWGGKMIFSHYGIEVLVNSKTIFEFDKNYSPSYNAYVALNNAKDDKKEFEATVDKAKRMGKKVRIIEYYKTYYSSAIEITKQDDTVTVNSETQKVINQLADAVKTNPDEVNRSLLFKLKQQIDQL